MQSRWNWYAEVSQEDVNSIVAYLPRLSRNQGPYTSSRYHRSRSQLVTPLLRTRNYSDRLLFSYEAGLPSKFRLCFHPRKLWLPPERQSLARTRQLFAHALLAPPRKCAMVPSGWLRNRFGRRSLPGHQLRCRREGMWHHDLRVVGYHRLGWGRLQTRRPSLYCVRHIVLSLDLSYVRL